MEEEVEPDEDDMEEVTNRTHIHKVIGRCKIMIVVVCVGNRLQRELF